MSETRTLYLVKKVRAPMTRAVLEDEFVVSFCSEERDANYVHVPIDVAFNDALLTNRDERAEILARAAAYNAKLADAGGEAPADIEGLKSLLAEAIVMNDGRPGVWPEAWQARAKAALAGKPLPEPPKAPVEEGEVAWVCVPVEALKAGRPLRWADANGDHFGDQPEDTIGGPFTFLTKQGAEHWAGRRTMDLSPVPVRVSFITEAPRE